MAACIASGLYGIEHKLVLDEPARSDAPRLHRNLMQANTRFHESELGRELLGDTFVEHFSATRDWEWRQFQDAVTDWELRRYLEII